MNFNYTTTGSFSLKGKTGYRNVVRVSQRTRPTLSTLSVDPIPTLVRATYAGKPYNVMRIKDAIVPAVTARSIS